MTLESLRPRRKSVFRYPMNPVPRTAVLAGFFRQPGFRPNDRVRVFPGGWSEEVAAFAPAAIAATRPGGPLLSASDRERLWQAFHVPVFEQIIGPNGELLAAECEAHDGLHVEVPGLSLDGYRLEVAQCGCGRAAPRLAAAQPIELLRSIAAYAR